MLDSDSPQEKTSFERQRTSTDKEIDGLVYDLYGLTAEEIAIVEEATARGAAERAPENNQEAYEIQKAPGPEPEVL